MRTGEASHRVFRSEHLAIAAGMVPVSSAFVLRIVVQVQVPRGLKHARLFRSSSRVVAATREQTATRSSSRVLDIRGFAMWASQKRSKLRHIGNLPAS